MDRNAQIGDLISDNMRSMPINNRRIAADGRGDPQEICSGCGNLFVSNYSEIRLPSEYVNSYTKYIFDFVVGFLILIAVFPAIAIISIALMATSPGPVFFIQNRRGRGGRIFRIFKFRTMTVEASKSHFVQAQRGDARITRIGAFLRRSSLDELPQVFNVCLGQMSLVGPRPHPLALDDEHREIIANYDKRYYGRPGLTGLAQISGSRGPTPDVESMRRRIDHDLAYMRRASMVLDLRILARTALEVAGSKSAF